MRRRTEPAPPALDRPDSAQPRVRSGQVRAAISPADAACRPGRP
ncbi:hypothetical protein [Lysobacter gummosus]